MKKLIAYILGIIMLAAGFFAVEGNIASANPTQFLPPSYGVGNVTGTSATTSFSWITPGAGTTTVSAALCTTGTKCDKAAVFYQITATNTAQYSKLEYRVEYSLDNTTWFSQTFASTSASVTGVMPQEFAINVATSTTYGNQDNNNVRFTGSVTLDPIAPYVRVVFFSPIGGANFSLWTALTPFKELNY